MEKFEHAKVSMEDNLKTEIHSPGSDEHALDIDTREEHDMTLAYVWRHHKMLVWWSVFYAMSAVGW